MEHDNFEILYSVYQQSHPTPPPISLDCQKHIARLISPGRRESRADPAVVAAALSETLHMLPVRVCLVSSTSYLLGFEYLFLLRGAKY